MKVWKLIPLLLVLVTISACTGSSADSETAAPADDPRPTISAAPPAPAPKPAPKTASAPKTAAAPEPARPATPRNDATARPVDRTERITLPAGSEIAVILADPLNSGKNEAGDEFEAHLANPVTVNGVTIFDRGTRVQGKVADAEDSGRVKGLANMRLILTSVAHGGRNIPITTKSFFAEAESSKGRDAAVVGGGAGIGAAIGAITGGKKGAATGAIIGGAAGTGTVLATKGKEVDFPAETRLTFTLADDLTVSR
jgi:hypothetical protein